MISDSRAPRRPRPSRRRTRAGCPPTCAAARATGGRKPPRAAWPSGPTRGAHEVVEQDPVPRLRQCRAPRRHRAVERRGEVGDARRIDAVMRDRVPADPGREIHFSHGTTLACRGWRHSGCRAARAVATCGKPANRGMARGIKMATRIGRRKFIGGAGPGGAGIIAAPVVRAQARVALKMSLNAGATAPRRRSSSPSRRAISARPASTSKTSHHSRPSRGASTTSSASARTPTTSATADLTVSSSSCRASRRRRPFGRYHLHALADRDHQPGARNIARRRTSWASGRAPVTDAGSRCSPPMPASPACASRTSSSRTSSSNLREGRLLMPVRGRRDHRLDSTSAFNLRAPARAWRTSASLYLPTPA